MIKTNHGKIEEGKLAWNEMEKSEVNTLDLATLMCFIHISKKHCSKNKRSIMSWETEKMSSTITVPIFCIYVRHIYIYIPSTHQQKQLSNALSSVIVKGFVHCTLRFIHITHIIMYTHLIHGIICLWKMSRFVSVVNGGWWYIDSKHFNWNFYVCRM